MKSVWFVLAPLLALTVSCAGVNAPAEETAAAPAPEAAEQSTVVVDSDASVVTVEGDPDIICVKVRVTGSHIKKKRCTTRAQREAERRSAQEFMRRSQRSMAPGGAN